MALSPALARLDALASPPLSQWLAANAERVTTLMRRAVQEARAAQKSVVDSTREVAYTSRMQSTSSASPSSSKMADPRFHSYSVEQLRNHHRLEGRILRAEDGTRAVNIGWDKWRIEPAGSEGVDAAATSANHVWIAEHGPWAVEAHGPPYKAHSEVVYLDLDGTGRKVYLATASKYEVAEYEKAIKAWEKAGKPSTGAPRRPTLFYVEHKGVQHAIAPTAWYGVTDAVSWYLVGEPRPTRRAEAAKAADRRALSPGAAAALDAMVLHVLPDVDPSYRTYSLTVTDLWRELTENRENVFARLHNDSKIGQYPWEVAFTPQGDDDKLFEDAAYSSRLGERLIAGSLRRLVAGKWAAEHYREGRGDSVKGYVCGPRVLSRKDVEAATGYGSPMSKADRAADEAEKRLRSRSSSSYGYLSTPEYKALSAARDAVRAARAAVAHPAAEPPALPALASAVARLAEVAESVP